MSDSEKMLRVSRKTPCPVCGKPDWCLIAEDRTAAICQRIEEGSVKSCGNAGYLHILADRPKDKQRRSQWRFTVEQDKPDRDFTTLQQQYSRQITNQQLNDLSQQLGVSTQSLKRLCIGWDGQAYTFGMSNDFGKKIIGIRRRFSNGQKVSLTGSKTGLFISADLSSEGLLLICEGPTDTAAAIDLGFDAIGRPNCSSCVDMTARFAKGRNVVIIGDNDKPGKVGVEKLAWKLLLHCPSVKIVYPPDETKDLRQWLRAGLTSEELQQIIGETEELQIKISFKD